MSTFLGLTPFIAFFLLMRLSTPLVALAAAFVISAALMARGWHRGSGVKILELGSLILFGLLTLYTVATRADWSVAGVKLAVDGGLAAVVLASLAARRPFTLQYAKEQVPEQFWKQPLFIRTNDIITGVWALEFLLASACDAAAIYLPSVPLGAEVAVSIAALVGAIWFTAWYPARVRRRIPATVRAGS
jgi:intracellular septation protein A